MAESLYKVVTEAICEWMKRHAQQYPDREKILKPIYIPEGEKVNFTVCKKAAFKKLEKAGYILEYESDTNARVVDYKPPENIGKKVAEKILGRDLVELESKPEQELEPVRKSGKGIFVLNETVDRQACVGIGKIIEALADFPADKLVVKIQISKVVNEDV